MTAQRSGVLFWIIAFKAVKATALTALGMTLLTTRHADPVAFAVRLALAIHLPLTSRLLDRAIALLSTLTVSKQTTLAVTAFGYAVLMASEGVALYFRKPWARWFTLVASGSLIPIEVYEIMREVHPVRVVVLMVNVGVVVYLWLRADIFEGQRFVERVKVLPRRGTTRTTSSTEPGPGRKRKDRPMTMGKAGTTSRPPHR